MVDRKLIPSELAEFSDTREDLCISLNAIKDNPSLGSSVAAVDVDANPQAVLGFIQTARKSGLDIILAACSLAIQGSPKFNEFFQLTVDQRVSSLGLTSPDEVAEVMRVESTSSRRYKIARSIMRDQGVVNPTGRRAYDAARMAQRAAINEGRTQYEAVLGAQIGFFEKWLEDRRDGLVPTGKEILDSRKDTV